MSQDDRGQDGSARRIRPLSSFETIFIIGNGHFVGYSMLFSGQLELAELDAAFVELQCRHEALQSVVRKSDFEFVALGNPPAHIRIFQGKDPRAQVTGSESQFDQEEQLSYVDVVPGEKSARVTLFVHHSIADARYMAVLLYELWSLYTHHVETGGFPQGNLRAFPLSGEHFLNCRSYPGATPSIKAVETPNKSFWGELDRFEENPPLTPEPGLFGRILFDHADKTALVSLANAKGGTLITLVAAAVIRAHGRTGAPLPLCWFPVDLRENIHPPVGPTDATNLVGGMLFDDTNTSPDLVTLARKIKDKLARDIENGVSHRFLVENKSPLISDQVPGYLVHITHVGRLRIPQLPKGLTSDGMQLCFASKMSAADLEKIYGQPTIPYLINSFGRSLTIESPIFDENGAQLMAYIEEELRVAVV